MKCNDCINNYKCLDRIKIPDLMGCSSGVPAHKVLTNADRIRSMSDEELAEWLNKHDLWLGDDVLPMTNDWLEWLQSSVDEASEM